MRNNPSFQNFVIIFLLLLTACNLLILNLKVFNNTPPFRISQVTSLPSPAPASSSADFCPQACLSLISDSTASAIGSTLSSYGQTTLFPASKTTQTKEYYIPLGSGNTGKTDWDDIVASETIIDPTNYGNIKEAFFTASLRNPTQNGQVEAQLYNVTDKQPVWGSHVVMKDLKEQTIGSGKITLANSAKLYRVQVKSSMSYPAYLDNAKIRIVAEN